MGLLQLEIENNLQDQIKLQKNLHHTHQVIVTVKWCESVISRQVSRATISCNHLLAAPWNDQLMHQAGRNTRKKKRERGKSGSKGEKGEPTCGVNLQTSGEATIIEIQLLDEDEDNVQYIGIIPNVEQQSIERFKLLIER